MRLFFAIDLPKEIKEALASLPERYGHLAFRWTKPENLHLTLLFLGEHNSSELPRFVHAAEEAAARHKPFSLTLTRIRFAPPDRPPRMVWLEGETPVEFLKLARDLETATGIHGNHSPTLHITLARSRNALRAATGEILETLDLPQFETKEFLLIESKLQRGGAEYIILKSFSLSGNA